MFSLSGSPFPVAPADGTAPAAAGYHPDVINVDHCLARRTTAEHGDRRWYPFVYASTQCTRLPVRDSDLCETCKSRAEKAAATGNPWSVDGWHGRVTDAALPATSHLAGSDWFQVKPVWRGAAKPQTAKQRSPRHKATPWNETDMAHVVRGDVSRDMYRAIQDNVIATQLLRDGVCMLMAQPAGAHHISWRLEGHPHLTTAATRKELADLIYHLMVHPDTEVHCLYKESEVVRLRRLLTENGIAV
jgi:hypothetical protein